MVRPLFRQHYPVAYLLRTLVVASLLPAIVGFAIFVLVEYREERQRLIHDNTERARLVGEAVDNHILRTQALARSFAGADEILAGDLHTFSQRATRAIRAAGLGSHILVYRREDGDIVRYSPADGRFVATQYNTAAPRAVLTHGAGAVSDVAADPASGKTFVNAHVPVTIGGKTAYSIAIAIPTAQLTAVLQGQGLPAGWLASLTDRHGVIAGRSRLGEKFVGELATVQLRAAISASNAGTLESVTREGIPNLTAFSRSPRTGYTAVIGVPRADIIGPLKTKLAFLVGIFALLLGLGLLLARCMSRLIADSMRALIAPAIALGKGTPGAAGRVHLSEAHQVAGAIERAAELLGERDAALRAQQEELQRFYFFSENANEMLLLLDESGKVRYANRMAARRLGYSNAELLAMVLYQFDLEATPGLLAGVFTRCRIAQLPPFERQYQCKDGSRFPVEITATVLEHKGEWLMHVAPRDISERVQSEHALRWAASHDALTGLANRAFAREFLGRVLAGEHGAHGSGALLYIDLDRFKPVNDLYSHEIGDRVLVETARRMQGLMRQGEVLARVGGDEFIAILPDADGGGGEPVQRARALLEAMSSPISLGSIEVKLSASVGISRFPEHGNNPDVLLHAADLAMLQAKNKGRNTCVLYAPEMDERAQFLIHVEQRLRQALDQEKFVLHFQPIVNLGSGAVDGVEALVRLDDGAEPPLGPAAFIPVAEMCGLIAPLDRWVALQACRQQGIWRDAGIALQVSVNVSALQFQRADFVEQVCGLIEASGIDPRALVIELTETAVMENLAEAARILNVLRTKGIRIALDDFGTGYSSLSILSTLPIDKIKIDQSFTRRIDTDHASRAVIDTIIALAKSLQLELVAEGIETEAALRYLQERGCEQGQGYYFSRPLAAAALVQWHGRHQAQSVVTVL